MGETASSTLVRQDLFDGTVYSEIMSRREVDPDTYEAVLFDMDGVLLEGPATPASVYTNAADDAIAEFGLDLPEDERQILRKYNFDEQFADRCHELGVDPNRFWQTRERFASERANQRLDAGQREPYEDTTVISDLPVHLGIVSNNRHQTVEFVADSIFPHHFDVAIGRDPTPAGFHRRKPESYYLERAVGELDIEQALYVGDRGSDLEAARAAGLDGVFVRREHNRSMSFDQPPTVDIDGLEELGALF